KPLSLIPHRGWQCLTTTCNPLLPALWRECDRTHQVFDVVHASAFPYAFPIWCARRLARRLGVPFLLTPFLHLGDPLDPDDATRRAYTSAALLSLAKSADVIFVQTPSERRFWRTDSCADRARRLGPLTEEQKRDFFAGLDVFALPSRSDSFGLVLLEAWANGLPNLAYHAGGVADLLRHDQDGLLAPS